MARKNKSAKSPVSTSAAATPRQGQQAQQGQPAQPAQPVAVSPMRVLALGGMGLFIVAMFLGSFISRMSQDTRFEDRRPQGGMGGMGQMPGNGAMPENMPPAMAEAMKKAQQGGQQPGQAQQTPQGMPGQAMAGLDEASIGRVGALMRQMQGEPNNATLLAMLADEFMHVQDWDASISFLNRALVIEPANARVMGLLGISHFNNKEYETAAQYFESLLTVEPDNAGAHYNLGMIYTRFLNKPEEGRRRLEALLTLPTATAPLRQEAQTLLSAPPAPAPTVVPGTPPATVPGTPPASSAPAGNASSS